MKPLSMYVAYKVSLSLGSKLKETDLHLTVSFMDVKETDYTPLDFIPSISYAEVTGLEYWPGPDITVMLVKSNQLEEIREMLDEKGFTYGPYEFRAHITLCKGNQLAVGNLMVGAYDHVRLHSPYLKIKQF